MKYFVSFFHEHSGGFGIGNAVVFLDHPIASLDDTITIQNWLQEKENIGQVSIIFFDELPDDGRDHATH